MCSQISITKTHLCHFGKLGPISFVVAAHYAGYDNLWGREEWERERDFSMDRIQEQVFLCLTLWPLTEAHFIVYKRFPHQGPISAHYKMDLKAIILSLKSSCRLLLNPQSHKINIYNSQDQDKSTVALPLLKQYQAPEQGVR